MRIRTLKNCLSEGVKGIFRNGFMSVASIGTIAVCLIILGIIFCLVRNVESFVGKMDGNLGVVIFMKEGITDEETEALLAKVESRDEVKEVKYISAEEAWASFREELLGEGELTEQSLGQFRQH
jgi:cell division transport system permease protein